MKKLVLWAIILSLNSTNNKAEDIQPTESTKGCLMSFCNYSGGGTLRYFVKIADSEYDDPDTGEPQIWGYAPLNKRYDRNGKIIFERAREKDFIRAGGFGRKEGQPCTFRCPLW